MELKKRFRLTLTDYTAFNFFHLKGRLIALPIIFIVLMPVAIMLIDLANYGYVDPMILIAALVVAVVLGAVVTLINIVSVRYSAKNQYKSSKAMQSENDITVDQSGVHETGEYGNTVSGWFDMIKATESPSSYNIYFSRLQAFVIPKRILTPDEEEILRTLVYQHLPPEKVKLRRK